LACRRPAHRRAGRLNVLDVYRQYWRINLLTTLEYRTNFLLWFAFTFVYHGSAIVALWVTLTTFPSMNGWDFRNMLFLYALWMVAHAVNATFFSTVGSIPDWIRDGEFDRLLVRPLDELFQVISTPGAIFPDELLLALGFFVVAIIANHMAVTFGFVLLVTLIVLGGALIDLSIGLIISTVAFWFVQVDALRWIVLQLEQEFTRYPLSIYSKGVRLLLAFVIPFGFMNYFPASYFLHKADNGLGLPLAIGLLTPAIGIVFLAVAYLFWRVGLQRYQGVGH
jgi:ABC-2 type transport system permease protein